jgi:hypothetical protein
MKLVRWTAKDEFDQPPGPAQGGDVYLVEDDADLPDEATDLSSIETVAAVPARYDLKPSHPLYGKRALRSVPSGCGDIVVSPQGVLEGPSAVAEVE